eukprot:TRINITY_DN54883_c0_g1_i1.p1 TRINITY_DN54883_c0_g1~~TRINITY_DN54883_c0_g1_i1.p1  ORF type:complete len:683 (+),score=180.68 TRINITY_DN54883_c0_g1_i1:124-2049(+)
MDIEAARNAVRNLSDGDGLITEDALRDIGGFEVAVSATLERELGPGPWPQEKVQDLVEALAAAESETLAAKAGDVVGLEDDQAESRLQKPNLDLAQLELAVDAALRSESLEAETEIRGGAGDREEPESEEPSVADAVEVALASWEREAARQQREDDDVGSDDVVGQEIDVGDERSSRQSRPREAAATLIGLLRKTWRLAHLRGDEAKQLRQRQQLQDEEMRRLRLVEANQDSMETTTARLTAARKSLKERDWELASARNRLQDLEIESSEREHRFRQLETAAGREALKRLESERRVEEVRLEADSEAAQQRTELRRQLAATQLALEEAQEELAASEKRWQESRQRSERHTSQLELELAESRRREEELRRRLASSEVISAHKADAGSGHQQQIIAASANANSAATAAAVAVRAAAAAFTAATTVGLGASDDSQRRSAQGERRVKNAYVDTGVKNSRIRVGSAASAAAVAAATSGSMSARDGGGYSREQSATSGAAAEMTPRTRPRRSASFVGSAGELAIADGGVPILGSADDISDDHRGEPAKQAARGQRKEAPTVEPGLGCLASCGNGPTVRSSSSSKISGGSRNSANAVRGGGNRKLQAAASGGASAQSRRQSTQGLPFNMKSLGSLLSGGVMRQGPDRR